MNLLNGIGCIKLQMIIYLCSAIISWPLLVASCRLFGLPGIVIMPAFVYLMQALFGKIQLHKYLSHNANGIWGK